MNRAIWLVAASLLATPLPADDEPKEPPSLLGEVDREEIEKAEPDWVAAQVEAEIDADAASGLAGAEPGATVQIYFGTWCSDSRREIARFWRALDENLGVVPFEVEYVAVDRSENRPPDLAERVDLRYVPTFVVHRDGAEVGRVVEVSDAIERDLLALLSGEAEGVLSARDDLEALRAPAVPEPSDP